MRITINPLDDRRYTVGYDYAPLISRLLRTAVPSYARRWDDDDRVWIVDSVYHLRCFIEALRYRGHDVVGDIPDMPLCRGCGSPLSLHNLVGSCRECLLIARNERMGQRPDTAEPVSHDKAVQNVAAVLGGRPITDTAEQAATEEGTPR